MDEEQVVESNSSRMIPLFECDYDIFDSHLEFYTALGFEIIYYQKSPYRFASVKKDTIGEIGFYGARKFKEEGNIGGCYVHVSNIRETYEELKANLKAYYGRVPATGTPRFSRLNKTAEDWRVNITDPSGNTIIVGESIGDSQELMNAEEKRVKALKSKFEKAYSHAYRFTYSKEDFLAARNTLEAAFAKLNEEIPNELLFKAKVLQAEIFLSLSQNEKAKCALHEADNIDLTKDEMKNVGEFTGRFDELKNELK